MGNAKYHSTWSSKTTNHEHEEGLNDCFHVKTLYWNSESNSNKARVIGKNMQKKKKLKKKSVVIDPMADKSYLFCSTVVLNNYIESYRNDME